MTNKKLASRAIAVMGDIAADPPSAKWFEDARIAHTDSWAYAIVMRRWNYYQKSLEYVMAVLQQLPFELRTAAFGHVVALHDDVCGLLLDSAWKQSGGNYDAWADAGVEWFEWIHGRTTQAMKIAIHSIKASQ